MSTRLQSQSQVARLLTNLTRHSLRHPRAVLMIAAVSALLCLGLAATGLELQTSNLDLVSRDLGPVANFSDFAEEFGSPNVLVVVLESTDEKQLETTVRRLEPKLRQIDGVRDVFARLDYDQDTLASIGADEFLTSYDRQTFYMFVQPADPSSSVATLGPLVENVEDTLDRELPVISAAIADTTGEPVMRIEAGLTGLPKYAVDDRDTIQKDVGRLSSLSLFLVLAVFFIGFSQLRRPLLAILALLVSVAWTLAFVAIAIGHLTLLSAFFATIVFGLGIDFGIHIVSRLDEAETESSRSILEAVAEVAAGLGTGALTTAGIFFMLLFSGFLGFAELGVIAGVGVLLALVSSVTVLPALLLLFGRSRVKSKIRTAPGALVSLQHPWVAIATLALTLLLVAFTPWPDFDGDYSNLQPLGSHAVELEREMASGSDLSPQFAAFVTDSRERAAELSEQLLSQANVGEVFSITDLDDLVDQDGKALAVPRALERNLVSDQGRYAVYAYPAGDAWNAEFQKDFVTQMSALDAQVTGMPILGSFMVDLSKRAMVKTAILGGVLLLVLLFIDFRSLVPVLLATVPVVLTLGTLGAAMSLLGLELNSLSIMALPVIIGVAVDDGVHLVHRSRASVDDSRLTLESTGKGIVLTSATTLASFLALGLASHRGLASFALVLSLGVGLALLYSLLVLPALLLGYRSFLSAARMTSARRRRGLGALGLLLPLLFVVLPETVAAGSKRESDRTTDRIALRTFVPSDHNRHGEVRLVARKEAWVLQTVLLSRSLERGVRRIRRKELYAWSDHQPGHETAQTYLEMLERCKDAAIERTRGALENERRADRKHELLLEFTLSASDARMSCFNVSLDSQDGGIEILESTEIEAHTTTREYMKREFRAQLDSAFAESSDSAATDQSALYPGDLMELLR